VTAYSALRNPKRQAVYDRALLVVGALEGKALSMTENFDDPEFWELLAILW